jgi:hypothetical protein
MIACSIMEYQDLLADSSTSKMHKRLCPHGDCLEGKPSQIYELGGQSIVQPQLFTIY